MNTDMYTVVEISFDKMVGDLFIDSMSSVTHEAPPWLVSNRKFALKIKFFIALKFVLFRSFEIAISDSFKDFFK